MDLKLKFKFEEKQLIFYCHVPDECGSKCRMKGTALYERLSKYPDERIRRWMDRAQNLVHKATVNKCPTANLILFTDKEKEIIFQKIKKHIVNLPTQNELDW